MHGRRLFLLSLLAFVLASGCAGNPSTTTPARVTGVVVEVTSQGLGKVTGFVLKDGERNYEIMIDRAIDYSFPLDHLSEHQATGDPLKVRLEERGQALVALSIEDA